MTISEYINKLVALLAEHGDLEVVDSDNNTMPDPEMTDDVIVLCEQAS